jgi:hypothetical protein
MDQTPRRGPLPPWTDGPAGARVGPPAGRQLAMPAPQSRRAHEERRPAPRWKHPRECRGQGSIRQLQSRAGDLSAQHHHLMAQHQQFDVLGGVAASTRNHQLQHPAKHQLHHQDHHSRRSFSPSGQEPAQTPSSQPTPPSEARHASHCVDSSSWGGLLRGLRQAVGRRPRSPRNDRSPGGLG